MPKIHYFKWKMENENNSFFPSEPPLQYTKVNQYTRQSRRFRKREIITEFKINHKLGSFNNFVDVSAAIDGVFENIINDLITDQNPNNLISAYIIHHDLATNIF